MRSTIRDIIGTAGVMALITATALLIGRASAPAAEPAHVICESGSERRDPALDTDPYYVATLDCHAGSANGPVVHVIIID